MLQNTDYILGLVLSTGIETKINYSDSKKKSLFQVSFARLRLRCVHTGSCSLKEVSYLVHVGGGK